MSDAILREVLKIQREKAAVKVANISDVTKRALMAQLEEKLKKIEMELGAGVTNVKAK